MTGVECDRTRYAQLRHTPSAAKLLVARATAWIAPIQLSAIYLASVSLLRVRKLSALAVKVDLIGFPLGHGWSRLP